MTTMGLRGVFIILVLLASSLAIPVYPGYAGDLTNEVGKRLRDRIASAGAPPGIVVERELILTSRLIGRFYQKRAFRPAWSGAEGPTPLADALVEALRQADAEGLRSGDYHLEQIETGLAAARQQPYLPETLADLDLLLTDAWLLYASHLLAGHVNPETLGAEWYIRRPEADLVKRLRDALESGDIAGSLNALIPDGPGYGMLRHALKQYRDLAAQGGWLAIPDGPTLKAGDSDPRVTVLRARLIVTGELDPALAEGEEFDDEVEQGVIRFQQRHGLDPDGTVGPRTLAALNVTAEEREKQIVVNLERMRWLPAELGSRYIMVNVANFGLDVVEEGQPVLTMRAIVGRTYRQTPSFTAKMNHLIFSPYWHIPHSIAVKDLLPKIQKDRRFLAKQKIRVFRGSSQINPASVNWRSLSEANFPYRLRQDPGPLNSLGRVKFMLPNRFNVYIHDTPTRELFDKAVRDFSSGCIRIDMPVELAEYLLADDPEWTSENILAAMEQPREKLVRLRRPIPVYFLYSTAWVDAEGTIQFRDDLYGRDALVATALEAPPPGAIR
ncbi:murein L,D-transpeptidase [Geobacter sp.]|uniref:L,D-transpeptidase family protein n=1 Tax=Geobacter sp. TaxID=46610 RepID=UPI0027BA065A|nr:L,D-transpeptidase family protein [Geobacter sp.]